MTKEPTPRTHRKRRALGCLAVGSAVLLLLPAGCRLLGTDDGGMISEAALEWAEAHPENFATRAGVHAAFAGPEDAEVTLFVVHGSPGNWSAGLPYLENESLVADTRVIAFDRPGYGKSGAGETVGSLAEQAARLAIWAEDRPGRKLWLGHSFGAPIIARLAIDRPDLVDGLILSAGAMEPDLEQPRWFHHLGDTLAGRYVLNDEWTVTNQECLAFADELAVLAPQLNEIACPVFILHARDDALADFRHAAWTADQVDNPDLVTVVPFDSGNHFILWNRVEDHLDAFRDWESRTAPDSTFPDSGSNPVESPDPPD